MPAFAVLFLTFFVCSLLLLGVIVTVLFPVMLHTLARTIRISRARRLRDFRYSVDESPTEDQLCKVEAVYRFEVEASEGADSGGSL